MRKISTGSIRLFEGRRGDEVERYSSMERVSAFPVIGLCKRILFPQTITRECRFALVEFLMIIASIVLLATKLQIHAPRPFPP